MPRGEGQEHRRLRRTDGQGGGRYLVQCGAMPAGEGAGVWDCLFPPASAAGIFDVYGFAGGITAERGGIVIAYWFPELWGSWGQPAMVLAILAAAWAGLALGHKWLPIDGGRPFAHQAALSKGHAKGAGLIFILVWALFALLLMPLDMEILAYILLTIASMATGYLDDASKAAWGRFRKGLLDLAVSAGGALVFVYHNGSAAHMLFWDKRFALPELVFFFMALALLWGSINVTNCADGVDGLSGSLSISGLWAFGAAALLLGKGGDFWVLAIGLSAALAAYLWFNTTPNILMMGDAGSRALGFFLGLCALKSGSFLLYGVFCLVLALDGGLGLVKVVLIKTLGVHLWKDVRMPFHDHARKNWGWSNTQLVYRFVFLQVLLSLALLYVLWRLWG